MTIFVSYRREDCAQAAGLIYEQLARRFTRASVFMDRERLLVGDELALAIDGQLGRCRALVAVIGPTWLTCARAGKRRLDHEDDWVRREIAFALTNQVPIVPVLVAGAKPLSPDQLPADLGPLANLLAVNLDDSVPNATAIAPVVRRLRQVLGELGPAIDGVGAVAVALMLLADLMDESPAVADMVGRYREAVAANVRQLGELDVYKRMHDALHDVENGLRVLRRNRDVAPQLKACRARFGRARALIDAGLPAVPAAMGEEITLRLDAAAAAFDGPIADPSPSARVDLVILELSSLLGSLPTELDHKIAAAAAALHDQGRLDQLARDLRADVERHVPDRLAELSPLFAGLTDLESIRAEFSHLVDEHTRLQRIDAILRELGANPRPAQWRLLKRLRAQLPRPLSPSLAAMWPAVDDFEVETDAAFAAGSSEQVAACLDGLHETFITAFHDVDGHLKQRSNAVSVLHGPLLRLVAHG